MLGRYVVTVLDEEMQLLQIAARTPAEQSLRLNNAYAALIEGLYAEVADWIKGWAPKVSDQSATPIAAIGVNALLGKQATKTIFRGPEVHDDNYVAEWMAMLAGRIEGLR